MESRMCLVTGHFLECCKRPKIRIKDFHSYPLLRLLVFILCFLIGHIASQNESDVKLPMTPREIDDLKEEARDMFYHAYRAYMENAYPADELMPLSCKGRWKDPLNSRGDLDDTLGNFSLTLIDSLDTLVILGDLEEFESAVKLVIRDVSFDQDVVVSVFETNIRVLGGMLSAHILSEYVQQKAGRMLWYNAELLTMAKDLGYRLLPAFHTATGIPYSRVNLRHGMKRIRLSAQVETCTACAGTMVLEMAALSRLTGEPLFEEKAHKAMDELWRLRNRSSNLMGTVLNVHSGDWVRRDSGVGAGIDSYYEYCLKAYILLGDETYLNRFNRHYHAVMKYISQGPLMVDVLMHRPHTNSKNFMDALLAFWPGLQVLKGDLKPAVATHEMLYQVMQRHNLLPEAFTTDFQVHWGQHPLRPEFVESTYFLYQATNDPYYLEVGKVALKNLQRHARVPCGYATIKDVRTGGHDDRMDSFVLAETFKYLYLLFANPNELLLDLDDFLFTTEAHLLPLSLARSYNGSRLLKNSNDDDDSDDGSEFARCCPNTLDLFPETVRQPLKNMVDGVCPRRLVKRKLYAAQFAAGNAEHIRLLKNMGITILALGDGQVHLVHSAANARSSADAEEGLMFMQEMSELAQDERLRQEQFDRPPLIVRVHGSKDGGEQEKELTLPAGRAHFGMEIKAGVTVTGLLAIAEPLRACDHLVEPERLKNRVVIVQRGDCIFVNKVRRVERAGALAVIVVDNTPGSSSSTSSMFAMSGDGTNDMSIPAVFLFYEEAKKLLDAIPRENPRVTVTITEEPSEESNSNAQRRPTDEMGSTVEVEVSEDVEKETKEISGESQRREKGKAIIKVVERDSKRSEVFVSKNLDHLPANSPIWLANLYERLEQEMKIEAPVKYPLDDDLKKWIQLTVKKLMDSILLPWGSRFVFYANHCESIISSILKIKYLFELRPKNWEKVYTDEIKVLASLLKEYELITGTVNNLNGFQSKYDESHVMQQIQVSLHLKNIISKLQKYHQNIVHGNENEVDEKGLDEREKPTHAPSIIHSSDKDEL